MKNSVYLIYRYFRTHPAVAGLLLVTIVLAVAYILRLLTPESRKVPSIPMPILGTARVSSFTDTEIVIDATIELPSDLAVYSATRRSILVPDLVTKLAMVPSSSSPNSFMSANKKQRLSFNPEEKRYEYRNSEYSGNFDSSLVTKIDTNSAIKAAEDFAKEKLAISNLKPVIKNLEFYEKEITHAEPTSKEKANLVAIPFSYIVNDSISFIGIQEAYPLKLYVDSANQVTAFSLSQDQFTVGNQVRVETFKLAQLPLAIRNGSARIINIKSDDVAAFTLSQVRSLTLTDFSLTYRYSPESGLLVPYLDIVATAVQANVSTPSTIRFVVPAVQTNR